MLGDSGELSVFLIGGERLYQEGLRALLSADGRFRVCGAAPDLEFGLALLAGVAPAPAVVLVGIDTDQAPAVVGALRSHLVAVTIVSLGVVETPDDVVAWAESGVDGYVPRDASIGRLTDILEAVARGESLCSPAMTAALMQRLALLARERPCGADLRRPAALTRREREVAGLIDVGLSNKQIAQQLQIELPTVKNHVHNVLEKLGVARRQEAAALLRQQA